MKKLCTLLTLLISGIFFSANAQISAYSFAASSGTYTYLTGGTYINILSNDVATSDPIPIGFEFVFNGISYTRVVAVSDGYLSFNTSTACIPANSLASSVATARPLLAPLWDDMAGDAYNGNYPSRFTYLTSGTTGNRIFTAEWKYWVWKGNTTGIITSFQVKLYEGINKIEFIYRPETGTAFTYNGTTSIGIAGSGIGSGNFLSLSDASAAPTVSSSIETSTITNRPVSGQVYTFTPPSTPALDLNITSINLGTVTCPSPSMPVSVNVRNAGINPIDFSSNNALVTVDVSGTINQNLSATIGSGTLAPGAARLVTFSSYVNLSSNGTYYFKSLVAMAGDGNTSNDTSTTALNLTTVNTPWGEGFANTGTPVGWKNTGWSVRNATGVTGNPGNCIFKLFWGDTTIGTFTTLPIGLIAPNQQLSFDYKVFNSNSPYEPLTSGWGNFKVQISTDCGNTFTTVDSVTTAGTTWVTKFYSLSTYIGQYITVRIVPQRVSANYYNIAMDNFFVGVPPTIDLATISTTLTGSSCANSSVPAVVVIKNTGTNLIDFATNNAGVTVNTTGPIPQSLFAILNSGVLAPGAMQTVVVSPNANFSAGGTYLFKTFVTVAGDGNTSNDTLTTSTTIATTATPWIEPFTTTATPTGWTTSGWAIGAVRGVTGNLGNNLYKNLYSSATTGTFTTISIGAISVTSNLTFDYKLANFTSPYNMPTAGWGNFKVRVSSNCGTSFTTIDSIYITSTGWVNKSYSLAAFSGQNIIVRIDATWLTGDFDLAFDNFAINNGTSSSCTVPVMRNADSLTTATTATVYFNGTGNSFIAEYGPVGFVPGTGATAGANGTIVISASSPVNITGLTPNTQYQIYIRQNCTAFNWGYSSNSTLDSFKTKVQYTNDLPADALTLTIGAGCNSTPYSNIGATKLSNEPGAACSGTQTTGKSVWFKFAAPASGFVKISTDVVGNTLADTKMALYAVGDSSNYNTFQILGCDDDNGVTNSTASIFYATGLVPNRNYYIVVDDFYGTATGSFCLRVDEANTSMIADSGLCELGQLIPNLQTGYIGWSSLTNFRGQLIANVRSTINPSNNVNYRAFVTIRTGAVRQVATGEYYLNRNFSVENSVMGNYDVQFFFRNTELNALQAIVPTATLTNINVTQAYDAAACNSDFGYGSSPTDTLLLQTASGSAGGVSWITVNTNKFSNFYLHPGITQLSRLYVFTGNGMWSNPANWSNNEVPPTQLPPHSAIEIKPVAGGQCILDVPQRVPAGSTFRVKAGMNVVIPGSIIVQ